MFKIILIEDIRNLKVIDANCYIKLAHKGICLIDSILSLDEAESLVQKYFKDIKSWIEIVEE